MFPLRQSGVPAAPTSMLELRPRLHSTPQPEKSKQVHRTSFLRITRRDTSSSEEKDYSLWYRHPCTGFRISIYIPPPKNERTPTRESGYLLFSHAQFQLANSEIQA